MHSVGDKRPGSSTDALASAIGNYILGDHLRETRSGAVFLATHVRTEMEVEIKMLRSSDIDAFADVRTRREVEALTRLSHPSLARVFAVGRDESRSFMVMEHRTGRTLEQWIEEEGPMPLGATSEIHARILDGLAYCHANGVLHRDVCPAHILLTDDGEAILQGFGLVKTVQAETDDEDEWGVSLMADPALTDEDESPYRPLEFGTGAMQATTDVYSVGASLVYSLTGQIAIPAAAGLDNVPHEVQDTLAAMLHPDPGQRPDAATASNNLRRL